VKPSDDVGDAASKSGGDEKKKKDARGGSPQEALIRRRLKRGEGKGSTVTKGGRVSSSRGGAVYISQSLSRRRKTSGERGGMLGRINNKQRNIYSSQTSHLARGERKKKNSRRRVRRGKRERKRRRGEGVKKRKKIKGELYPEERKG